MSNEPTVMIGGRPVGGGHGVYVIAEVSANHGGDLGRAEAIVHMAAHAGADAVKFQTYRPDTITMQVDAPEFTVGAGSLWSGRTLHELYAEAQTPWEWMPRLFEIGHELGVHVFSSVFDATAVEFLESLDPPAYKIASFEIVDLALVAAAAATKRPLIMSTGMASVRDIDEAVECARAAGAPGVVLLRCNSAYPAPAEEMDLATISDMRRRWHVPIGLSDHTLGMAASIAAVALGASVLERHVTLSRDEPTADAAFSLEPAELTSWIEEVRDAERVVGSVRYGPAPSEAGSIEHRRSLYVVADVEVGAVLDTTNVRSIRPGDGLAPRELPNVLGRRVVRRVARGTPLSWDLLEA